MSSAKNNEKMTVIHWFRKGLRLHDNPALLAGLQKVNGELLELRPVFILDPWFVKHACVGVNRWRFLIQSLENLDKNLKERGSRLFLIQGKPDHVFEKIFKEWRVKRLTYESDTEPYAKTRDVVVEEIARRHQVEIVKKVSHTLYDLERIVKANGGAAPLTYQKFQSVIGKLGNPETSLPAPKSFPDACKTTLTSNEYDVPKLEDLDLDLSNLGPNLYPGGESEALDRLEKYMKKQDWVCKFSKPDTSPNSISPSTTVLSPYLKFGCLSPRLMFQQVQQVIQGRTHTSPPTSLIGQLYWREFFYTAAAYTPNFDKMEGNPICKQIPWENNPEFLEAWKYGRTGYPFIDAIMTQLRTEGWIHHLARHAVACFLTRGDLWISWVDGVKVFEEFLLDADWSLNAANWMWLSASAFFHQYFRVYSPVAFGKKTDKNGDYIKKYLPILKKFPAEYIYEPWKAPLSVQKAAGCIIGKDYPKPIVDHDVVSKRNLQRMGAAYKGAAAVKEPAAEKPAAKRKAKDLDNSAKGKTAKITSFLKKK